MKSIIIAGVCLLLTSSAHSAPIFCGDSIISEGDSKARVEAECGTPDRESYPVYRNRRGKGRRVPSDGNTWYYNQGPKKSIKKLYFSNEKLQKIDYE